MPRNGSGSFGLVAGNPVVPSTVISSTWANNTLNDIASGLTQSLANDGQTTPVANLPMATFRHTNVGNAVARNDYAAAGQVQDSSLQFLTSVSGADTITASLTPSPGAYAAGQTFRFVAAGANTTAVTLNINGLGAKAVTKSGTNALAGGEIPSGSIVEVVYDGTQFQLISAGARSGSTLIQTTTLSGSLFAFTGIVSAYDIYEFEFSDVKVSNSGSSLSSQFSSNGGSSYITSAVYAYTLNQVVIGTAAAVITQAGSQTSMLLTGGLGNGVAHKWGGRVSVRAPLSTSESKMIEFHTSSVLSDNQFRKVEGGAGLFTATSAVAANAIKFFLDAGTFTAGKVSVYGKNI